MGIRDGSEVRFPPESTCSAIIDRVRRSAPVMLEAQESEIESRNAPMEARPVGLLGDSYRGLDLLLLISLTQAS